eukprot:EG_transcript_1325
MHMWLLGAHNHSLVRLYRFKDASFEGRYEHRNNISRLWFARLHYFCSLIVGILYTTNFIEGKTPTVFWIHLTRLIVSIAAIAASHFPCSQSSVVTQHGSFCLLEVGLFASLLNQQIMWTEPYTDFLSAGSTLVLVEADGSQEIVNVRLFKLLLEMVTQQSLSCNIVLTTVVWLFLALMGLDGWTIGVNCLIPVVYTLVLVLSDTLSLGALLRYVVVFLMIGFISLLLAATMERGRRLALLAESLLEQELQASQRADSILNHTLKNILADVAGSVELFLEGVIGRDVLEGVLTCLTRGMKLCKQRNVYMKLVTGEYIPIMNVINLREFGQQLVAGRNISSAFVDLTVHLDCTLLTLVLENGISNAIKHGHAAAPNVCLAIREVPTSPPLPGRRRLCFSISNEADPSRPALTPEVVDNLFRGPAGHVGGTAPPLSERIGLTHCALAARAGGFALSLRQEGRRVVFSVEVDVEVFEGCHEDMGSSGAAPNTAGQPEDDSEPFPTGLVFAVLDDSAASLRLVEHHLRRCCAPADVLTFGAADVEEFLRQAVDRADVVILDQHLEHPSFSSLGTDVVARLRQRHFRGLVCIRSAADSPEDRQRYSASGAHCTLGKDVPGPVMIEQLKAAYLRFRGWQPSLLSLVSAEQELGLRCASGPQLFQCGEWAQVMTPSSRTRDASIPTSSGTKSPAWSDREVCFSAWLPGRVGEA